MGMYQLTAPSMEQLQTCYSQKFGEKFPLAQYMSLYDNWEAKKLPTQSQPTTHPKTGVWQTAAGSQTSKHSISSIKGKDSQ